MTAPGIFKAVPLAFTATLRGETCAEVHVYKPTVRQMREWSDDPQAPSPMVRTPGGQFLADGDMDDLLAEDADAIAAAVLDFLPPRLRAVPASIPEALSPSSPSSEPRSPASES
ncbi:MAG: hypothetical protein LCH88_05330 [Proteobacteria bacterium]|nr:hypothetical protein [Pseudomonadota bacterium]